jgi:hypothetical protein
MSREPLRSILLGYTVAFCGAVALSIAGAGLAVALLVVWIGGAVATLGVAAVGVAHRSRAELAGARAGAGIGVGATAPLSPVVADDELLAELARWNEDAAADAGETNLRRAGPKSLS